MGVMWSKTKFSEIRKSHYLFSNYNYFVLRKEIDSDKSFLVERIADYFDIISGFAFSSKDYQEDGILVCRIGDISKTGEIILSEMRKLPSEYAERYKSYLINKNDILIGMTGDGKYFKTGIVENLTQKILLNQRVGILRLKETKKEIFKPKFLSYLLRTNNVQNQIKIVAMGKTQKNVSPFDILNVKFPRVSFKKQNQILTNITPIEQEIKTLKESKKDILGIINEVFGEEFNIELEEIKEIDRKKTFSISLSGTYIRNSNLRNSLRWNKMQEIQKVLYSDISCIKKLGNYIIETKNGWSPNSQEGGDGTLILGQEHFNYSGKLKISPTKATEETKSNISDFYIKNADFFVSRGNTVDLVALASIVQEEIQEEIIFPDLYIKITFNEEVIVKEYIALLFNSFFGRYYFKYVSKGKNQTMVKISSKELNDFFLPIPSKEKQNEIVEKIKSRIDEQKDIDKQIEEKQNEISELIENAIKENANT